MRIAVVIPVYKKIPSSDELQSLKQCLRILGEFPIHLVCPEDFDASSYEAVAGANLIRQEFESAYFVGIEGYNRLMMSHAFYQRFRDYDYILIYQLDAWVFRNELRQWCQKGYDYVGAPWFEKNRSHEEGGKLWLVGNGGLSLRKVSRFLELTLLPSSMRVKTCRQVFQQEYHGIRDLGHCLVRCCGPWIGTNSIRHLRKRQFEDLYFCAGLKGSDYELNMPSPEEAAFFAFECSPAYLFEAVTNGEMPFGCHAWRKYQYDTFWKERILPCE